MHQIVINSNNPPLSIKDRMKMFEASKNTNLDAEDKSQTRKANTDVLKHYRLSIEKNTNNNNIENDSNIDHRIARIHRLKSFDPRSTLSNSKDIYLSKSNIESTNARDLLSEFGSEIKETNDLSIDKVEPLNSNNTIELGLGLKNTNSTSNIISDTSTVDSSFEINTNNINQSSLQNIFITNNTVNNNINSQNLTDLNLNNINIMNNHNDSMSNIKTPKQTDFDSNDNGAQDLDQSHRFEENEIVENLSFVSNDKKTDELDQSINNFHRTDQSHMFNETQSTPIDYIEENNTENDNDSMLELYMNSDKDKDNRAFQKYRSYSIQQTKNNFEIDLNYKKKRSLSMSNINNDRIINKQELMADYKSNMINKRSTSEANTNTNSTKSLNTIIEPEALIGDTHYNNSKTLHLENTVNNTIQNVSKNNNNINYNNTTSNLNLEKSLDNLQTYIYDENNNGIISSESGIENSKMLIDGVDWEFWSAFISNSIYIINTQYTKLEKSTCAGIPESIRGMVWQIMLRSNDNDDDDLEARYFALINNSNDEVCSAYDKQIIQDVKRTHTNIIGLSTYMYTKPDDNKHQALINVLKAYALYDKGVGYCQGMSFVLNVVMEGLKLEEEAFKIFCRLMQKHEFNSLYNEDMYGLQLFNYQFEKLILLEVPDLYMHLKRQGVSVCMYATQWFITMFTSKMNNIDTMLRILDIIILKGKQIMHSIGLELIKRNKETLLTKAFDDIIKYLNNDILQTLDNNSINQIIENSVAVNNRINTKQMKKWEKEFMSIFKIENKKNDVINKLTKKNQDLKKENEMLKSKTNKLTEQQVELGNELVLTQKELSNQKSINVSLSDHIDKLKEEINSANKKETNNTTFTEELNVLGNKNVQLINTNIELQDRVLELENMCKGLEAKINSQINSTSIHKKKNSDTYNESNNNSNSSAQSSPNTSVDLSRYMGFLTRKKWGFK